MESDYKSLKINVLRVPIGTSVYSPCTFSMGHKKGAKPPVTTDWLDSNTS